MQQKTKKSTKLFLSGVLILTFSNILIKVIGLTLKIPLSHLLGDDGMAYYNVAYDIYVWFYMISTAGLPVAISILISESRAKGNFREARRIFRITLALFVVIGLAGMAVMIFGSRGFAAAYKFPDAYIAIVAIAPTLFLICVSSAIRGYFQGYQNMLPTAVSQIIEALGKLTIGIFLAKYALSQGYDLPKVAAYTILGLTIGVGFGMLFLCISKLTFNAVPFDEEFVLPDSDSLPMRGIGELLKIIIITAIPITLSSSVMSFTNMIDGMILSRRLQQIGYSEESTRTLFGNYKTLAVSMFNLPPALVYPISYSTVPLLSAAVAQNDRRRVKFVSHSILKTASLITIPCAFGMAVLSEPILKLLFAEKSAVLAAPKLSLLAFSIIPVGMLSMTNAMLQAHKYERKPIISMLVGSVVKLAASYVLIGIPAINIYGAPIGTFLSYLSIVLVNFWFVKKYLCIRPRLGEILVRPVIAGMFCAGAAYGSYMLFDAVLPQKAATICAILCAGVVYVLAVFLMRCISEEDIRLLPKGDKLYSILHKVRLV